MILCSEPEIFMCLPSRPTSNCQCIHQAMCICEKESIDEVIARLAFFGVGNLVGSINVLSLESTKFYRPPKPEPSTTKEGQELPPASVNSTGAEAPLSPAAAAQEAELAEQVQKKKRMVMEAASQIRVEQVVESIKVQYVTQSFFVCC